MASNSFMEGLVSMMRHAMLKRSDYAELVKSESLEGGSSFCFSYMYLERREFVITLDLKLHLKGTDYERHLETVSEKDGEKKITVQGLKQALDEKLISDFKLLKLHATPSLGKFLDYVTLVWSGRGSAAIVLMHLLSVMPT